MVLDLHRQRAQEAEAAAAPPQEKKRTLHEVQNDPVESKLFGKMLELEGPSGEELGKKMADPENVQPGDIAEFNKRLEKFNEKMNDAKAMGDALTPQAIRELAKQAPFLKDQLDIAGPEKLIETFRKMLARVAVTDESRFQNIKNAFDAMQSYRDGSYRHLDEQVTKICRDFRLSETRFVDIMREPNPAARVKLFRTEIRGAFGFRNFITAGIYSRVKARALESRGNLKAEVDRAMKQMDDHMFQIGSVLGQTIEQNDDVRVAFMREILNDKTVKPPEQSFKDMRAGMQTEKSAEEAWEAHKKTVPNYATKTDPEKQQVLTDWKQARALAEREKGGFWASIGAALGGMLLDKLSLKL